MGANRHSTRMTPPYSTRLWLVDNNITRGHQRRPDPEMVEKWYCFVSWGEWHWFRCWCNNSNPNPNTKYGSDITGRHRLGVWTWVVRVMCCVFLHARVLLWKLCCKILLRLCCIIWFRPPPPHVRFIYKHAVLITETNPVLICEANGFRYNHSVPIPEAKRYCPCLTLKKGITISL